MKSFCVLLMTYCVTALFLMQKNAFAQEACSGGTTLYQSSGTLNVPGNATVINYDSIDCSWTISVATGKVVNVTFTQFYLPHNLSSKLYLDVMENGRSVYGYHLIGTDLPKTFTSKTNEVMISYYLFPASSLGQFQSIQLMWQQTEPVNTPITNFNCGSLITDSEGTITSPGFPNNYANNLDCQWTISASTDQFVTISFPIFDLEPSSVCLFDYLTISSSQKTEKRCSNFETISMQGPVTIHFHSDDSVTWKGFSLSYLVGDRSITACSVDGLNITAPTGNLVNLQMPNTLYYYCVWRFVVDSGKILQLTFHQFDVPCGKGSLALSSLPYIGVPPTLCGATLPKNVQTPTNTLEIIFYAVLDTNVTASFNLSWISVDATKETVSVNASTNTVSGLKGYITSPNYPNNYTNNIDLRWTIENPSNHIVRMETVYLELENAIACRYDYLILHNSSTTKFQKLCKQPGSPHFDYTEVGTTVGAVFHSDRSIVAGGFVLAYAMQDSNNGSVIDKSCGTTNIYDKSGFISSPGFPFSVNSVSTCQWTITAPTNQVIEVNFVTMDFRFYRPCSVDNTYLEFQVGHSTASLKRFCSSQGPVLIRSNVLAITYRFSNYSFNFEDPPTVRFLLHYEMKGANASVPTGKEVTSTFSFSSESISGEDETTSTGSCGGTLNTNSSFKSSKFSGNYLNHLDCYWTLPVKENEVVEVHLGWIDLEVSENCSADVLEIYGADNSSFNAFCDFFHVGSFKFTGTDVIIHFRTDYAVTKSGFSGYFTSYMEGESPSGTTASNSLSTERIGSSTENLTATSNPSFSDSTLAVVSSTTIKTTSSTQGESPSGTTASNSLSTERIGSSTENLTATSNLSPSDSTLAVVSSTTMKTTSSTQGLRFEHMQFLVVAIVALLVQMI